MSLARLQQKKALDRNTVRTKTCQSAFVRNVKFTVMNITRPLEEWPANVASIHQALLTALFRASHKRY